jgi:hypothetical protein
MLSTELARQHQDKRRTSTSIFQSDPTQNALIFNNALLAYGRRPCVSEKGYIGLVSAKTEVVDKIAILSGASTPYLLRETDVGWLLVGECYIHGAMDGEALEEAGGPRSFRPYNAS